MKQVTVIIALILLPLFHFGQSEKSESESIDKELYLAFVTQLTDSLHVYSDLEWLFVHPVIVSSQPRTVRKVPPPPESILEYPFDSLSFHHHKSFSVEILSDSDVFKKPGQQDMDAFLEEYQTKYGTGLVISMPYQRDDVSGLWIDFEFFDWSGCGTEAYQSIPFEY